MPRFTVKDLLIATTLVAIGAGMISFACSIEPGTRENGLIPVLMFCFFGGLALIGAGLGTPFHRPWTGAIAFVIVTVILAILIYVVTPLG